MEENAISILNFIQDNTLSKQNRFSCEIQLPDIISTDTNTNTLIQYYINGCSLPSSNLNVVEVIYLGKLKYSITSQTIDTINVTFYDTERLVIRSLFVNYLDSIKSNKEHSIMQYYPNEFWCDLDITIHESRFKANKCTPVSVGDFVLDHSSTDSIGTFSVTFKTKYLEVL